MDYNLIMQTISTVGFPIAMCLFMMYYIQKKDISNQTQIKELSEAINNNTLVITKLMERLKTNE